MRVYYFSVLDKTETILRKKRDTVITDSGEYKKSDIAEMKSSGLVTEYEMTKKKNHENSSSNGIQ